MEPQNTILEELKAELKELAPSLAEIPSNLPYQVPAGYFNQLSETISEQVQTGLLYGHKETGLRVPDEYFESFSERVMQNLPNTGSAERAKIIPIRKLRNWMIYSAAAMLMGVMVIGSFLYADKKQGIDFEKYQQLDIASALDQVTEADLNEYLDNNPMNSSEELVENDASTLPNAHEKIQQLSSEGLHHYLNENRYLEPAQAATGTEK